MQQTFNWRDTKCLPDRARKMGGIGKPGTVRRSCRCVAPANRHYCHINPPPKHIAPERQARRLPENFSKTAGGQARLARDVLLGNLTV